MKKFIIIFSFLILIIAILFYNYNTKDTTKSVFLNMGYSEDEIIKIEKYLSSDDINYLMNYNYIDNLSDYIEFKIFKVKNLDRYINYKQKYPNLDFYHTILYVNMNLDTTPYENVNVVNNPNDVLVLVNKYNKLPDDYVPNDLVLVDNLCSAKDNIYLRSDANEMFYKMCINMHNIGLNIKAISGYRKVDYQAKLFDNYILKDGIEKAIKYSAKPRHSEHETGLSVDVMGSNLDYTKFIETDEYNYIKEHAMEFGFIIRYENEFVTSYIDEAWHLRYVGVENAKEIAKKNITLDEYVYIINN